MWNSEKMLVSLDQGDLRRADKYFQRALTSDDKEVLLELAIYLQSIGFYPQAKQAYLQLQNDFPEVNLNLAEITAEDGQLEEAFLYLDQIDETSPDYVTSLLVMADLYDSEGLTDVAREKLVQASQLSDDPLIRFGLAELDYSLENFQVAIEGYAQLDNRQILADTGISTYQRIGRAYASLGKFEAATDFLAKAVEIEYEDQTVFELACLLLDQEDYQRANSYFKQLETLSPDFVGYEYAYAKSLQGDHQLAAALRVAQQGLTKNEFDSQLLLLASQLAYENHEEKLAETYLLQAKDVAEDLEPVLLRLANLYLEQERYQEVLDLESEELESSLTKWTLAKAHQALEHDDRAKELYDQLAGELADNPDFLKDYAYLLRELGYQEQFQTISHAYLKLVPDDSELIYLLED